MVLVCTTESTSLLRTPLGLVLCCMRRGVKNPRILLDSGSYVYGCECWWGAEEAVKDKIGDRKVIHEEIAKVRKEVLEEE